MDGKAASFRYTTEQKAARPKGTGCDYLHSEILLDKDMMSNGYTHQMLYSVHYKIPFQDLTPYFKTVLRLHVEVEKFDEDPGNYHFLEF